MKRIQHIAALPAILFIITMNPVIADAQALLSANGPGNTYEDITHVFAPGTSNGAVEPPDTYHPVFGRHITEVFDAQLNKYVFEFYIHVTPDGDISTGAADRQRVEIKTYASSPDSLKGTIGETITYKWKFRLAAGFQPSANFTHVHQIKAVDGPDSDPVFTLTARKGSPDKLQLIYNDTIVGIPVSPVTLAQADLSLFRGVWVDATEVLTVGDTLIAPYNTGRYSLTLQRSDDGSTLLSYYNADITTIRPGNSFVRPKWGIYRSLLDQASLRNDTARFSDFYIKEGIVASSQTYYYVGGTGPAGFSNNNNWNTKLDGTGYYRSALGAQPGDIFVFDGSNVGGTNHTVGAVIDTVTNISIAQLKLQNNADITLQRPLLKTGTGTITIGGDGSPAPDFTIAAGSSLTINSPVADGNVVLALSSGATGAVAGTVTLSNTGAHQLTTQLTGGLVFTNGATFNSNGNTSVYPFGSGTSQAAQYGVVFQAGANLVVTGNRSPMGNTSSFQACNMQAGSNFYMRNSNAASTGSYSNLKAYGNIFVQNNASFTADGPFYKIDNLTIDAGSTMSVWTSGHTPVLGNLVVNGTLTAPSGSNTLVMGAAIPQQISGSGTINIPNLVAAGYSTVNLSKNITIGSSCNIYGTLNFNSSQLSGAASFTARANTAVSPVVFAGTTTAGSYVITGITTPSGVTGYKVSGSGITDSTNATGLGSAAGQIYLSKPATVSGTDNFSFSFDTATLINANPNGFDPATGAVIVSATKSYQQGINYTINGACSWPFGFSSVIPSTIIVGKVILNASATTNHNLSITRGLFINAGNFTIRAADSVNAISFNSNGDGFLNKPAFQLSAGIYDKSTLRYLWSVKEKSNSSYYPDAGSYFTREHTKPPVNVSKSIVKQYFSRPYLNQFILKNQ